MKKRFIIIAAMLALLATGAWAATYYDIYGTNALIKGSAVIQGDCTLGTTTISAFAKTMLDDAAAANVCTTIGLGTTNNVTFADITATSGDIGSLTVTTLNGTTVNSYSMGLLNNASAANWRTDLGLATTDAVTFADITATSGDVGSLTVTTLNGTTVNSYSMGLLNNTSASDWRADFGLDTTDAVTFSDITATSGDVGSLTVTTLNGTAVNSYSMGLLNNTSAGDWRDDLGLATTDAVTFADITATSGDVGSLTVTTFNGTAVNAYSTGLLNNTSASDWRTDFGLATGDHVHFASADFTALTSTTINGLTLGTAAAENVADVAQVEPIGYSNCSAANATTDAYTMTVADGLFAAGRSIVLKFAGNVSGSNAGKQVLLDIDGATIVTLDIATATEGDFAGEFIISESVDYAHQDAWGHLQTAVAADGDADHATDTTNFNDGGSTLIKIKVLSGDPGDIIVLYHTVASMQ